MKKTRIIKIIVFLIIALSAYLPISMAASLTMSTSKSDAEGGETITITVNGNGVTGKVALSATGGTLSQSSVWVDNSKTTATVKVNGNSDVKVVATPIDVSDSNTGEALTIAATSATVKVSQKTNDDKSEEKNKENTTKNNNEDNKTTSNSTESTTTTTTQTKKSSNANLSDLGIRPNDFKGFKSGTTSYNVEVPNDVEKVEIYAIAQDKQNAKVTGGGNKKLNVGSNTFNIVVTAEDGKTKKTYTLNITRKEDENAKEDNSQAENVTSETTGEENKTDETTEIKADLKNLEISGYLITPNFDADVYEYNLTVPADVSDLEVKTEALDDNIKIDVAGNKDLKDGENIITVVCYNNETKKTSTYQIIVNKQTAENPHADAINEAMKKRNLIIKVGAGIIIILIILCIIVFKKGKEEYEEVGVKKDEKQELNEDEEKSNEIFRQISEQRKVNREVREEDTINKRQVNRDNIDRNEIKNKRPRGYTEEEIAQIRQRRIAEREAKEKLEKSANEPHSNEDLPKSPQKNTQKELSTAIAKKTRKR